MDKESKNYELAYLLSPSLPEEEVLTWAGKITAAIEESKGAIRNVEPPRKRKLSYLVKKQENAYWGWTTFAMAPEAVATLEKKIKGLGNILRHLIVEEEEMPVRMPRLRTVPSSQAPRAIPRETEKPEEKLDLEQLDKKLEEILGK